MYSVPNVFTPNTVISSTQVNSNFSDGGQALTDSLDRQGRGGMLANMDLGGFRAINAGAPLADTDLVTRGYYKDASNLTDGTIPDARLSSNVALKDQPNTFLVAQTISNSSSSRLIFDRTNAGSDQRLWAWTQTLSTLNLVTQTDGGAAGQTGFSLSRSGTTIQSIALSATTITLNGVDVSDYARKSQSNTFTSSFTFGSEPIRLESPTPAIAFFETDAALANRYWLMGPSGGQFNASAWNDSGTTATNWLEVRRSGSSITSVTFPNGVVSFGARPFVTGGGGILSHASGSNPGGSITISNTLAGSAGAVGGPGDMRFVYS